RQVQLPLPSAQPAWAWPQLSLDPQGERKDRHRNLCYPGRTAQGTTGSRDLSPLSSTGASVAGGQRKNLPGSTGRAEANPVEKKTAEIIQQEVARRQEALWRLRLRGGERAGALD